MDVGTISSRYVKALFSLAKDTRREDRLYDDMKMLAVSFGQQAGLKAVLDNPIIPEKEKARLLTTAAGLEVCDLFTRFIGLVLQHKRESLLPLMVYIYIRMYRKDKKITRVLFKTPVAVDEATQEHLKERLKEETGNQIEFTEIVRPELIGGFILRIGNYRIDASYARQLRDIRNQLIEKN